MRITVRARLVGLAAVGLASTVIGGLVSHAALNEIRSAVDAMGVATSALRNQVESDMMHDALRADVYAALAAESDEDRDAVRNDVKEHAEWFRRLVDENQGLPLPEATKGEIAAVVPALDAYIAAAERLVREAAQDSTAARRDLPTFAQAFSALETRMEALSDSIQKLSEEAASRKDETISRSATLLASIGTIGALALGVLAWWISRGIVRPLAATVEALQRVAKGDLSVAPDASSNDEVGDMARALGETVSGIRTALDSERVDWHGIAAQRAEVARLQTAVAGATTAMLISDRDYRIGYANDAARSLLSRHASTLRGLFPSFDPASLVGTCIDVFHRDPSRQRSLLSNPAALPHRAEIKVGPLTFALCASAILDDRGAWIGNTLEWQDVTEQRDAQAQIERLIGEATQGRLDERLDVSRLDGFLHGLGEGVNRLLDTVVAPVRAAGAVLAELEAGKLVHTMDLETAGEFARLRDALNHTVENLRGTVSRIREGAIAVAEGAEQIQRGNENLNERTQRAASALEQCAAAVEQLAASVQQNAAHAGQARTLALEASERAEQGGVVARGANDAMARIAASSEQIGDIVGLIDSIAFQTNLIALNAAVEAERAGEEGRGFSVVAAEVRNLAQRSGEAAKQIKDLIRQSVAEVEQGRRSVGESATALDEIIGSVKRASAVVEQIASACGEQTTSVAEIHKAVSDIDEATQQNAALVEEATAASESLRDESQRLRETVSVFETGDAVV